LSHLNQRVMNSKRFSEVEKYAEDMAQITAASGDISKATEIDEDKFKGPLFEIYRDKLSNVGIPVNGFCSSCEQRMFFNQEAEDFYCPACNSDA
jgi:Zn finger protein HypA/HybF involved in hydrogenase expression